MYLKRNKVSEGNPKRGGSYLTNLGILFYNEQYRLWEHNELPEELTPDFWYSEVTERLYTEEEMKRAFEAGDNYHFALYDTSIYYPPYEEFISQLNKDKDK